MSQKTQADMFLKTFFEYEMHFLTDRAAWEKASGRHFVECIMLFSEAWSTIVESRREYKLTDRQFQMIDKLYDMIKAFEIAIPDFPERNSEYRALWQNPDWKKLQEYAKEVHRAIYPYL